MKHIIVCVYSDYFWVHIPKEISAKLKYNPEFGSVNITKIVGFPAHVWCDSQRILVATDKKHHGKFSSNVGFYNMTSIEKLMAYFSTKPRGEYLVHNHLPP